MFWMALAILLLSGPVLWALVGVFGVIFAYVAIPIIVLAALLKFIFGNKR